MEAGLIKKMSSWNGSEIDDSYHGLLWIIIQVDCLLTNVKYGIEDIKLIYQPKLRDKFANVFNIDATRKQLK